MTPVLPMSMSSLTKDFTRELRDLSSGGAAGLIQNFQSLLKEGDMSSTSPKYNKDDIARICTWVGDNNSVSRCKNNLRFNA